MSSDFAAEHAERVRAHGPRPFLTWYDDATGERVELSWSTFDNWVAKVANYLVDGLALAPGATVAVAVGDHWQGVVVTVAAWCAGLRVAAHDPADAGRLAADVAFVRESSLGDVPRGAVRDLVGLSLQPLGGRLTAVYPGVSDFADEVPAYADHFSARGPTDGALVTAGAGEQRLDDLIVAAAQFAREQELGRRFASLLPLHTSAGWRCGPLAAWTQGAGVVLHDAPDLSRLRSRLASEQVGVVVAAGPVDLGDVRVVVVEPDRHS